MAISKMENISSLLLFLVSTPFLRDHIGDLVSAFVTLFPAGFPQTSISSVVGNINNLDLGVSRFIANINRTSRGSIVTSTVMNISSVISNTTAESFNHTNTLTHTRTQAYQEIPRHVKTYKDTLRHIKTHTIMYHSANWVPHTIY